MIPRKQIFKEVNTKEKEEDKKVIENTINLKEDKVVETMSVPNYEINEKIILAIAVDKNHIFRVLDDINGRYVDIRKFYKGFPTKNGIKIPLTLYNEVNKIINTKLNA